MNSTGIRSRMGNGALPNGPSYRRYPRLCRDVGAMREQQAKGNEMPIVNSVEKAWSPQTELDEDIYSRG